MSNQTDATAMDKPNRFVPYSTLHPHCHLTFFSHFKTCDPYWPRFYFLTPGPPFHLLPSPSYTCSELLDESDEKPSLFVRTSFSTCHENFKPIQIAKGASAFQLVITHIYCAYLFFFSFPSFYLWEGEEIIGLMTTPERWARLVIKFLLLFFCCCCLPSHKRKYE